MALIQEIQQVFASELGIPPEELGSDLKYGETPEWDSNSHMVLVMALEEKFDVNFESDEIVSLTTLGSIHRTLLQKGIADQPDA